jgi:CBS domain-containing protein
MRRLEKTIREIGWSHAVPRLARTERVSRAFDEMSREVHDCVLVMDGRSLAGIFTSRDFLNRIAAVRADPAAIVLGDVMTPTPCTLRPRDPVAFAINWMAMEGFRNVPIVSDDFGADGEVLGVLTVWDVMRHLEAIFDAIDEDGDATPRLVSALGDLSEPVQMFDLGGAQ